MSYNVLSKEGLVSWLERQPMDTVYDYGNCDDCLAARYLKAHGLGYEPVKAIATGDFHQQLESVGINATDMNNQGTYQKALELARTLP